MTTPRTHFIGINVSGTQARAALVDADGSLVESRVGRSRSQTADSAVGGDGRGAADRGRPQLQRSASRFRVWLIDKPIAWSRHAIFRQLSSAIFMANLTRATGLRVELENDANAAAYGEFKVGAGRGARNLFYMMIGNGIGGAIILDGKLWTGASGFAGEVGHITIDTEGLECVCGNTGCLETVASAPSIVRRARERLNRDSTSSLSRLALNKSFTAEDVAHQANEGDDFALMMIERTGKYIGTGVASVINLLNIERIVLGGGVMDAGTLILNPIIQEVKRRAFQPCFEATEIVAAKLGLDGAPIGAALLARDAATD